MRALPTEARKEKALRSYFHWFLIPSVFVVDRVLKIWVLHRFQEAETLPVWPGVFHLTRVNNAGAAFGLWRDASPALAAFSALSVLLITFHLAGRLGARVSYAGAWALVAGGALGNLYDRVKFGYVVDYVDLRVWPVFNLADACISVGVAWILLSFLKRSGRDRSGAPGPL